MKRRMKILIAVFALMPMLAKAELRSIAIEVFQGKDKTTKVTIHSEVKKENKKEITVDQAKNILESAKGWGSGVYVVIVTNGTDLNNYLCLIEAIAKNPWLDLIALKDKTSRGSGELILKHYNIEQTNLPDKK